MKLNLKSSLTVRTMKCLILVGLSFLFNRSANGMDIYPENKLRESLKSYDKDVHPSPNYKTQFQVNFSISMMMSVHLDLTDSVFKARYLTKSVWENPQLRWNQSEYNVPSLIMTEDTVWTPRISIMNSIKTIHLRDDTQQQRTVVVNPDGINTMTWVAQSHTACDPNVNNFPVGEQTCNLLFTVAEIDSLQRVILRPDFNRIDFVHSGVWKVEKWKVVAKYMGHGKSKAARLFVLDVRLTISPSSNQLIIQAVIPFLVISTLSALTYLLPLESGERISLSITSLLTMVLFVQYCATLLPRTRTTPPFIKWQMIVVVQMTASLIVSVLLLKMKIRTSHSSYYWKLWNYMKNACKRPMLCKQRVNITEASPGGSQNRKPTNGEGVWGNIAETIDFTLFLFSLVVYGLLLKIIVGRSGYPNIFKTVSGP